MSEEKRQLVYDHKETGVFLPQGGTPEISEVNFLLIF